MDWLRYIGFVSGALFWCYMWSENRGKPVAWLYLLAWVVMLIAAGLAFVPLYRDYVLPLIPTEWIEWRNTWMRPRF